MKIVGEMSNELIRWKMKWQFDDFRVLDLAIIIKKKERFFARLCV